MQKTSSNLILHNEVNNRQLEEEFLHCLYSRKIHSKFLSWGKKETERWFTACQQKSFLYYHRELALWERSVENLLKRIHQTPGNHFNFITMGMGDGKEDAILLHALKQYEAYSYIPVDISEDKIIYGLGGSISEQIGEIEAYVRDYMEFSDFSAFSHRIRKDNYEHHCIILLGNGIGHLFNLEALHQLRKGMNPGDYLVIGAMLQKKGDAKTSMQEVERIIEMYSDPTFEQYLLTPLEKVGITLSDGDIEIVYSPNRYYPLLYNFEVFFIFHHNKTITYLDQEISFLKGGKIRLMQVYMYPEETMMELLETFHFAVVDKFIAANKMAGIYLCTPQK
jgi:uncharacterized SAM-dependent methyltransferase